MERYHVEIARKPESKLKRDAVKELVKSFIDNLREPEEEFEFKDLPQDSELRKECESIRVYKDHCLVVDSGEFPSKIKPDHDDPNYGDHHNCIHNFDHIAELVGSARSRHGKHIEYIVFELTGGAEEAEYIDDDEESNEASPASHHWILPNKAFDGLWDSLVFETKIKTRLVEYVKSALLFSERNVNSSLISWNKVILLHGPPGTGKTSLCKALAQKATILLGGKRFRYGQLVEINSHSLFSRWFSESGKLVMKMFDKINELIEDPAALVFLLIDEIESLAKCRIRAQESNEPSDSLRAVNALLTQLDKIKRYPNVVILTTSNVVASIDMAFVDRADLKIYIGSPPPEIVYAIYASSLNELIRVGIISGAKLFPKLYRPEGGSDVERLLAVARMSTGLSGRTLRKIPFLAHLNFIQGKRVSVNTFLGAMQEAVLIELEEASNLK